MENLKNYKILICDDDEDILNALEIYLQQDGYTVAKAADGLQAVELAHGEVHLILLDVMMPRLDGIQAAIKIRNFSNVPIIFLSAKSEDTDRILGLSMGGDDYITKPFNPVELLARVKAALRRYMRLGGVQNSENSPKNENAKNSEIYQTGGLVLDNLKKRVTVDDREIALTSIEYSILHLLMQHMDRVFTSSQIYETVWDEPAFQVSKTVSVHVRHIREKIEINPKEPQYLKVVYGLGYKIVKVE
ncbi:MAG: response regulator transcription factor [Defluviitaleaceae bacterium]|nr:response regulator transcription factor [Defluviitaleaceae bacterium]